jgi:raffinose/stachyose/melibiose transport system substrate-binding protein
MTVTRRQLLVLGGTAGLALTLPSCADSGGTTEKSAPAQSSNKPVQYWTSFSSAKNQQYFKQHFVEDYQGSAKVQLTVKSNDTIDRLTQTALAAGKGPDIILTPGPSQVAAYNDAGYLADLTAYADKYQWRDKLAGWALGASTIGGKLVSLPTSYESMVFYFNPATLEKLQLSAPKNREEFENFCTTAKGNNLVPLAAGNADWKGANEWHLTVFLNHYAGPAAVYSALRGETPWTDPVFVDTVELLKGYFQKGWFGGGVDTYFTNQFPKVYKQLAAGEAAGMISGTWEMATLPDYFGTAGGNSADWDYTTLPALRAEVPQDVWDLGVGQSAGVNAKSPNLDGAVEYLNFLTTDVKTLTAAIQAISWQPTPLKLNAEDFSAKADPRLKRLYTELPAAKNIGYTTWTFYPQVTETYMIEEFERVITDKTTAQEFCAGVQQRFAKELAAGKVPAAPTPEGLPS